MKSIVTGNLSRSLLGALQMVVVMLIVLGGIAGCGSSSKEPSGLLPEIKSFLADHQEFGKAIETQEIPDWADGARQRVQFDSGRNLLFYTKNGRVVSVYDDSSGVRTKIWEQ